MKKIYFILLGIYILVLCFLVPSWDEQITTYESIMSFVDGWGANVFIITRGEQTATFNIVISLISMAFWAIIPAYIANQKGREAAWYFGLSCLLTPLITMILVLASPSLVGAQETEKQKAEDEELSQKHINENLEKVLDTVERQDDEDGISYLARCMREADKEFKEGK